MLWIRSGFPSTLIVSCKNPYLAEEDEMHRKTFVLTILIVFVLTASLTCSVSAAPPVPKANWTVMVYISGDNDLESYVVSDIEDELGAVGSSADVQVVALADRIPGGDTTYNDWATTKLFHVTKGMEANERYQVDDWGERDMADPQTLVDFVTWTKSNYPAEHYALYFWGHGWNWRPEYVMRDDTDADTMDLDELKAALPSIGFIDMVAYDGCNMAAIEVQLLWHGHATALAHSQEYVYWEGVQYDLVLEQLAADPDMTADQLAIATSQSATEDKTWSAVAVDDRFARLVTAVDAWSLELKRGLPEYRRQYGQAFNATQSFWRAPNDRDLYDMAYEVNRLVSDSRIRSKSQEVMAAVDAVVLHERHASGPGYAGAHGITIYLITKAAQKDSDYTYYRDKVDFAAQTGWDEFLDAYAR